MSNVLDIGGSSGIYLCALADARAGLRGAVLERQPIDRAGCTLLQDRGYHERIEVIAADMFTEPLPEGFDLHLFSHVLHDWDEQRIRTLLSAAFVSLAPGGWLVDHDMHVNREKTGPLPAAEYSVFLMHATPGVSRRAGGDAPRLRIRGGVVPRDGRGSVRGAGSQAALKTATPMAFRRVMICQSRRRSVAPSTSPLPGSRPCPAPCRSGCVTLGGSGPSRVCRSQL